MILDNTLQIAFGLISILVMGLVYYFAKKYPPNMP